jgi:hypothetical protein
MEEYLVDHWTDCLGQQYGPGDAVAYASIAGKSPQMVIAEVTAIRTHDKQGKPYLNYRGKPSASVTVKPLLDARDFYRDNNARQVSLKITENIIKIPNELKPKPKDERDREASTAGIISILQDLVD